MKSNVYFVVFAIICSHSFANYSPESNPISRFPFIGPRLPEQSFADGKADVALYVGRGTWDTGVEHLKAFLLEHGMAYQTILPKQILENQLSKDGIRLLIVPGGQSWDYLEDLGAKGAEIIRAYVEQGGSYVGICAGAFYAVSNREGGFATGSYGIGLLDGTAYDGTALEVAPFIEGMMDIEILPHFLLKGFKSIHKIAMFGGPSFRYTQLEQANKRIEVLAQFQTIHEPAMILFQFGKGRVYLSGPHLEIEEDRTDWGIEYADPESDWPILRNIVEYLL